MLPRSQRLSVEQFNEVIKKGRVSHSLFFYARILTVKGKSRLSAAVPQKVSKTAVGRNKLRRIIYEAVKPIMPKVIPDTEIIIIAKDCALKANFEEIKKDIENLFVKSRLLK